jgi:hypothetical protein
MYLGQKDMVTGEFIMSDKVYLPVKSNSLKPLSVEPMQTEPWAVTNKETYEKIIKLENDGVDKGTC